MCITTLLYSTISVQKCPKAGNTNCDGNKTVIKQKKKLSMDKPIFTPMHTRSIATEGNLKTGQSQIFKKKKNFKIR